jgi:uncharacterized LabA/DUF88 family protein
MARLAIFIDGGYLDALARDEFSVWVDYRKFSEQITAAVASKTPEPVDLLRTYYYHCLPYQSNPPTPEEAQRYGQKHRLFTRLRHLDRYAVREGRLMFRGLDAKGDPIFEQKRVDLLLGLDFALLSGKNQITHAAVVSGDSDLIPAFEVARQEGISLWLFHGPRRSKVGGTSTFANELWLAADERVELNQAFMDRVAMPPTRPLGL